MSESEVKELGNVEFMSQRHNILQRFSRTSLPRKMSHHQEGGKTTRRMIKSVDKSYI